MSAPSGSIPGRARARAPVASTTWPACSTVSVPPSDSTATAPFPASLPAPSKTATLFFFRRKPTPFESRLATARERATTFAASKDTSDTVKPKRSTSPQ